MVYIVAGLLGAFISTFVIGSLCSFVDDYLQLSPYIASVVASGLASGLAALKVRLRYFFSAFLGVWLGLALCWGAIILISPVMRYELGLIYLFHAASLGAALGVWLACRRWAGREGS